MARPLLDISRQMTGALALAVTSTFSLGGCAATPPSEVGAPTASSDKCAAPTSTSTATVFVAAVAGAVLDKATGGGRGFERAAAGVADKVQHGCPAPAPTPDPTK